MRDRRIVNGKDRISSDLNLNFIDWNIIFCENIFSKLSFIRWILLGGSASQALRRRVFCASRIDVYVLGRTEVYISLSFLPFLSYFFLVGDFVSLFVCYNHISDFRLNSGNFLVQRKQCKWKIYSVNSWKRDGKHHDTTWHNMRLACLGDPKSSSKPTQGTERRASIVGHWLRFESKLNAESHRRIGWQLLWHLSVTAHAVTRWVSCCLSLYWFADTIDIFVFIFIHFEYRTKDPSDSKFNEIAYWTDRPYLIRGHRKSAIKQHLANAKQQMAILIEITISVISAMWRDLCYLRPANDPTESFYFQVFELLSCRPIAGG